MFPLILPELSAGSTLLPYPFSHFWRSVNKICSCRERRRPEIAKDKGKKARVRSRASHIVSFQSSRNQIGALRRSQKPKEIILRVK